MSYFPNVPSIEYQGPKSSDPLAYRFYQADQKVMGKTMAEHLRPAVCYWHNLCWSGQDAFGEGTRDMPWFDPNPMQAAKNKVMALFEMTSKLNVPYFTFHDRDVAPEGKTPKESLENFLTILELIEAQMELTGIQLLWGTANLFSHRRFMGGAATNPDPEIFAMGAFQVRHAMDATLRLGGENYVLWGGREGYDTLLNTDLKQEQEQLARFLTMAVEYKHKIGFKGSLLIEPKPCEPTKHQYDYDTATVHGFLKRYGLEKEFKVNIEVNHATLSGHSFEHEVATACALDVLGSIDANRGDPQNGWDTDQFPNSVEEMSRAMVHILKSGGLGNGGFNFDTKVRRQSCDTLDMFYGHIGGLDVLAKSLLVAEKLMHDQVLNDFRHQRYAGWSKDWGQKILRGEISLDQLSDQVLKDALAPQPQSGRQEFLENRVNRCLHEDG